MPSIDTLTFDQNPPHRPVLSELGGGAKENDARPGFQPDPVKMITAGDVNQLSRQAEGAARMLPLARVWVHFTTGTPAVTAVQAPGNTVTTASFHVTDEGPGSTLISWKTGTDAPAGALPTAIGVQAHLSSATQIDRVLPALTTDAGDPAARVITKLGASATDADFCLEIY